MGAIIPQQETSGNYNYIVAWLRAWAIIPQQETSGNYNSTAPLAQSSLLYHNKKHQGTTTRPLQPFHHHYYTTTRNIRELQPRYIYPRRFCYYTTTRNIRELQPCKGETCCLEYYTTTRNIRELQQRQCSYCSCCIIPQQETSGNYNLTTDHTLAGWIIPQQETSGNYNLPGGDAQGDHIILHHSALYPSRQRRRAGCRQYHGQGQRVLTVLLTIKSINALFHPPGRVFSFCS